MKKSRFLLLFIFLPALLWGQGRPEEGFFLVKPYLQFATQNSIYVLWETTAPATTKVEYGEAQLEAREISLPESMVLDGERILHEVKLENLKVQTQYMWRVRSTFEDGHEIVSPVYTFRTAVKDSSAYMFALVGDSQYNSRTPWAWGKIADLVWKDRPSFVIHAGDLVDIGTKKTDWTQHFFPNGHPLMSRFPMYTVLGNHERDAELYYDYMVNPEPEYYYTFNYGNAQFFMIDTNKDVEEGSEQYEWLEWELARSEATWKFVVHHHPPYSSEENDHGDTYKGESTYGTHARNLVPLYETYGVDFCLFGHTHVYERTWPIFKDMVNEQEGVIYINSGGAGGGLEDFAPTRSWFSLELQTGHHYCTFAVFDRTLVFKAIDHEGRMFDALQMRKSDDRMKRAEMVQPPAPRVYADKMVFEKDVVLRMEALASEHKIYYTLDGTEPSQQSEIYTEPITLSESADLKARVYTDDGKASRLITRKFSKMKALPAVKTGKLKQGLRFAYYEGVWTKLPDFSKLKAVKEGVAPTVNESVFGARDDQWGGVLEGYIELAETGVYKFFTYSDDGSKLYIDDILIVDNDGSHSAEHRYGEVNVEKGQHKIRIEYFDDYAGQRLRAGIVDPEMGRKPLSPMWLGHE